MSGVVKCCHPLSCSSSFVYHCLILSTQSVGAMLQMVNGPTSKRPSSDGGRCSGQLFMMWSAVCSGSPHSHAALNASPHFFVDALSSDWYGLAVSWNIFIAANYSGKNGVAPDSKTKFYFYFLFTSRALE